LGRGAQQTAKPTLSRRLRIVPGRPVSRCGLNRAARTQPSRQILHERPGRFGLLLGAFPPAATAGRTRGSKR
jgi:hypothetical protein